MGVKKRSLVSDTTSVSIQIPHIVMEYDYKLGVIRGRLFWGSFEEDFAFSPQVFNEPKILANSINECLRKGLERGEVWSIKLPTK